MLLSTMLDVLYDKVQELGKQKFWFIFLVLVFVLITLINGLGIVPEEPYQRLSQNPFVTRTDIHSRNNFQETLLLPLVAFFLQLTSRSTFNILCYAIIACGYAIFAWYTYKFYGVIQALIFSVLLFTSPLTTVLFTWLGMPDGSTIALVIPLLFTNSAFLILFLTILGSTNHIVFIIAACEIIALRWLSKSDVKLRHWLALAGGGAVGAILVKVFLAFNQIQVAPRSEFLLTRRFWDWTKLNTANFPLSFFSLFNIQWLVILVCFLMFFKRDKRFYLSFVSLLVLNYCITFFSLDTTRIFSLLSSGIYMLCLFHSYRLALDHPVESSRYQRQFLQALTVIGLSSIISPRYFYWAGDIHATPFYEFIRTLIR